ncbi:MAG TPA: hypothetical protein VGK32_08070 [Vicinamibacterales bacterium]|jgi:hypothetical protein
MAGKAAAVANGEEKIPSTILDINAWPIPGILVFAGEGFSAQMRSYLYSTGKAVGFEDLEAWLRLFFGLPDAALPPNCAPEATA